jgi:hypothetical protein
MTSGRFQLGGEMRFDTQPGRELLQLAAVAALTNHDELAGTAAVVEFAQSANQYVDALVALRQRADRDEARHRTRRPRARMDGNVGAAQLDRRIVRR